jgi:hypothetical protein
MHWLFIGFLIASILHMTEEFFLPGGFMAVIKKVNPTFGAFVNVPAAIVINGLQLMLCVIVIFVGPSNLAFSLSPAGLIFVNGLVHLAGAIKLKGYSPGMVTGTVVYIPLSIFGFYYFASTGQLTLNDGLTAAALGIAYHMVPPGYFLVMLALSKRRSK